MHRLLPDPTLRHFRDRYLAGVVDAEVRFGSGEGEEDSLTGGLGQAISTRGVVR